MNQAYRINTWTPVHLMSHFSSSSAKHKQTGEGAKKDAFDEFENKFSKSYLSQRKQEGYSKWCLDLFNLVLQKSNFEFFCFEINDVVLVHLQNWVLLEAR